MNAPQAEGNVNSRLYSGGHSSSKSHEQCDAGEESSTPFSNNKNKTHVSFLLSMVELDHRRSDISSKYWNQRYCLIKWD